MPYIPGFEVSGNVTECGSGVRSLSVGDSAVAIVSSGGYSETVVVDEFAVRKIPPELSHEAAAAIPVNYLTAWFCLFNLGHLAAGESVLISAGAGGVGIAGVQLALDAGAKVIATAGGPEKLDFLRSQGVKHALTYFDPDWHKEARRISEPDGIDVVIDAVGGDCLKKSYDLLAPLGRLVSYGLSKAVPGPRRNWLRTLLAWWNTPRFSPLELIDRNVAVSGFHLGLLGSKAAQVGAAFDHILEKAVAGNIKPIIAASFPLTSSGVAEAHHFIHERRNKGKVILANVN
jgi:NADPH:quinone reductase-like Zn-dependent oxidoreductase